MAAPAMMPTEGLEAAIAELPAKKEALREAFDRLAACSPYTLPFTWEELDADVSSIHNSISRRFRQLRVLEAARPAHTGQDYVVEGEMQEVDEYAQEDKEEEQDTEEEMVVNMTKKQLGQLPPCRRKDLIAACERMDAGMLAQFVICVSGILKNKFLDAMFHAPDPVALVLQVVKLFLSSNKFKCAKVWLKCARLIRWLSMVSVKPSADTIEEAKLVAKDWKEMIDGKGSCGELDLQAAWGFLHFLISYNIVSEFNIHEIIRIFAMAYHKNYKKNTVNFCKDLGLTDRMTDLIDYLIGNGQHIENMAKPKEVEYNLWVARHLAEKELVDSSQRNAIVVEMKFLLGKYAKKRKQINKKPKLEEQECHEGQHSQQLQELNQNKLIEGKQHPLLQQENIAQVTQQQQDAKRPRQATLMLPTPTVPLVPNVAQIQNFGCPLYAAMPGFHSYPAQPGWPGAQGRPFAPQPPQYMVPPFCPSPPHPPFCPR
ncbi:hypothetical protein C2845_PM01G35960 [Panicum miliaceum]|uniref:FRIGIDA-like protein n=1 Tax=Panicum miliaceum TaxID=4540 RepID=A0A3L6TNY0_PANMI|nr:hypothetical protein C2845_PM01G35960 [Panicum miliaceum]